jgi:hypothetical protein
VEIIGDATSFKRALAKDHRQAAIPDAATVAGLDALCAVLRRRHRGFDFRARPAELSANEQEDKR